MKSAIAMACASWMTTVPPAGTNIAPLAFGMTPVDAAAALGTPLTRISGRSGSEIYVARRRSSPLMLYPIGERVYLQFRRGCLTGFKGDWDIKRYGPF